LREQTTFHYAKEAEMKEMLGNLADGQIELYRSVSDIVVVSTTSPYLFVVLGHGRVGQDYPDYSAYTRGRLAHFVLHIPTIISNPVSLTPSCFVYVHTIIKIS
jgi:hypothetical protein